jgi:acetylornithine deacetylase
MLCGHTDTVGVEGMSDPWRPRRNDGRMYGRGAQDMKGGVAAMMDAARLVAKEGFAKGRLVVAAVIDEEFASIGADALVKSWTADAAIVTEPTDLTIGVSHKGFAWLDIETRGRAAHGSRPADGRDALLRMAARSRAAVARGSPVDGHCLAARLYHRRRTRDEHLPGSVPLAHGKADGRR